MASVVCKVNLTIVRDENTYRAYSSVFESGRLEGNSLGELIERMKEPIETFIETWRLAGLYIQV